MTVDFDSALNEAASAILKRGLSEEERREFRDLADTIGMGSVEDYLYMLMVFKRNEDRISEKLDSFEEGLGKKFNEISELEKNINSTIEKVLGEGAKEIGRDMGGHIAEGAREVLSSSGDYHFLRGQIWIVFCVSVLVTAAYWLGSAGTFRPGGDSNALGILMGLPSGWIAFICGSTYSYMWCWDHREQVKISLYYKVIFGVQTFLLLCLLILLLGGG